MTQAKSKPKMVSTRIDMEVDVRQSMVELLNEHLAGTFDLFSHTKQAHWNVKGREFMQLHKLYDELAEGLLEFVDLIAERVTALGGVAHGTVHMAANASQLDDYPDGPIGSMESVEALAVGYARLGASAREAIKTSEDEEDMGTSDLFIELSRFLDKSLWFLEAHLQDRKSN